MSIRIVLAVVFLSGFLYGRIDVPKLLSDYQNLDQKVRELGERKRFLMLVNRQHAIPEDFIPNLTPTAQRPEIRLDIAACAALERMMEAAEEDGHTIIIASGYRDRSYQEDLLQEDIASAIGRGMSCEEAYRYVVRETMPPGCSEHLFCAIRKTEKKSQESAMNRGISGMWVPGQRQRLWRKG